MTGRASLSAIVAALDDSGHDRPRESDIPLPELPPLWHFRPCCAFGENLAVAVGRLPIPGVWISNLRGPGDIGPHSYDAGVVSIGPGLSPVQAGELSLDASMTPLQIGLIPLEAGLTPLHGGFISFEGIEGRGMLDRENNGLVYTCRAGFLDTAHVRENADLAMFLTAAIARRLDAGGTISLEDQGGARRVVVRAVDARYVERRRRELAVDVAAWVAFQISVWHEIAQWYGFASLPGWPERVSAFSIEDLYSNLFGIKLARGIVLDRVGIEDDRTYDRTMDAWLGQALGRVEVVSKDSARRAMRSVDGIWWNSRKRLPDWTLVQRRYFSIGPDLAPWLVSMTNAAERADGDCAGREDMLVLHNPSTFDGVAFADVATLEIDVSDTLIESGFPFPRSSQSITQADFPWLIDQIRSASAAALGPDVGRPD